MGRVLNLWVRHIQRKNEKRYKSLVARLENEGFDLGYQGTIPEDQSNRFDT